MTAAIARNLAAVRARIAAAAGRAGRDPSAVRLVAVTKTVGPEEVLALHDLGVRDFGENRVRDGLAKIEAVARPEARWHLVGHLQRNKAREALRGFRILHGVESPALVEALGREAEREGLEVEVLLEVNIAGEESKYGVSPERAADLGRALQATPRLRWRGLMTMAPLGAPEAARPVFRALRELRDRLAGESGVPLPELSMGMSGDFESAVEEGATMVRIGTSLFLP